MKKTNHSMPDLDIHSLQMRLPIMLSNSNIKLIPCQKIKFIKANRNYSQIIIDTGEEYTHTSCLKSFECRLSGSYFIRCHKSFIVNALFVSEVCKKDKQIVLSDGCILPCSTDAANKIIQLISVAKTYGNGVEISNNFDTFGLPAGVKATKGTTLQHLGYVFDPKTGNMTSRSDQRRNITETFEYDNLDRLLSCSTMGNDTYTEYSANGNIKSTDSMGEYRYGISGKPYAVSGIENIANAVPNHTQTISYTSFKRPQQITQNNNSLTYTYNSAGHRAKAVAVENGSTTTTYTFGGGKYEKIAGGSGTKERLYIGSSPYNAPLLVEKAGGATTHYYLHRDCLGSITAITNQSGTLEAEYSYTAWGLLRNPANWQAYATGNEPALMFGRGYTGHAHMPQFGLVNMNTCVKRVKCTNLFVAMPSVASVGVANARLYDPLLCRFLSPDPYVQMPDFTQSFNRYSYCWNNPLKFTDPDGEFIHLIIGAVIGGTINWIANGAEFSWKGIGYFGVGAAAGALGAGVGAGMMAASAGSTFSAGFIGSQSAMNAIATSYTSSFLSGSTIGGVSGFAGGFSSSLGNGLIQKQPFGSALMSGVKGGIIGGISGAALGGLLGGFDAVGDQRNFWTGDDQGSGRSLFAFNNSDRPHTHYRTRKGGYELIDNIDRKGSQWVHTYDERVQYGTGDPNTISNGAFSRRDNYLLPGDTDMNLSLSGFKGRANVNFSGHIPEGTKVQISFDGKVVRTYIGGIGNQADLLSIPSSINNIIIKYIVPNNYIRSGSFSPWKTTITGFKRYRY